MTKKQIFFGAWPLCMAAGWYRIIWGFSSQTGTSSGGSSNRLLSWLLETFIPAWGNLNASMQTDAIDVLSFFIRKGAHMTCYFILAVLLLVACSCFGIKRGKRAVLTLAVCIALSAIDEYHQTFVQGREGALSDVGIDLLGVLIALALVFVIEWAANGKKRILQCSWFVWAGGILAAGLLLPFVLTKDVGMKIYPELCAQFVDDWNMVSSGEQTALIVGLIPVTVQIVQLIFAVGIGCAVAAIRRKYGVVFVGSLLVMIIWGMIGAVVVGGSSLWGACAALAGFMIITISIFGVEIGQKAMENKI